MIPLLGAGAVHCQLDGYVVVGHGILTRIAPEPEQLGHRQLDKDTVNGRKRVDEAIAPLVHPREVGLGNFNRAVKGGKEGGGTAGVTIAEGLAARVEPSLVQIAYVEVAHEETDPVSVRQPSSSRRAEAGEVPAMCHGAGCGG